MKRLLWIILGIAYVSGCGEKDFTQEQPSLPEGVVGVKWLQEENDHAYKLVLREDGTISYSGNPYHDFDLCEKYTYNEESHEFSFNSNSCKMKFINLVEDGKTLILLVNGKKSLFIGMYNKTLSSVFI